VFIREETKPMEIVLNTLIQLFSPQLKATKIVIEKSRTSLSSTKIWLILKSLLNSHLHTSIPSKTHAAWLVREVGNPLVRIIVGNHTRRILKLRGIWKKVKLLSRSWINRRILWMIVKIYCSSCKINLDSNWRRSLVIA